MINVETIEELETHIGELESSLEELLKKKMVGQICLTLLCNPSMIYMHFMNRVWLKLKCYFKYVEIMAYQYQMMSIILT